MKSKPHMRASPGGNGAIQLARLGSVIYETGGAIYPGKKKILNVPRLDILSFKQPRKFVQWRRS